MNWRIYYGDGSTFSDRDGSPYDAPPTNVQCVAVKSPISTEGKLLAHGKHAYYWSFGLGWVGCDEPGMWDYLLNIKGPKFKDYLLDK